MASSNFKIFDENKGNILSDQEYLVSSQRINGVQSGIASSKLNNKFAYQVSLLSYALTQLMVANGIEASDTLSVTTFVNNVRSTVLSKILDKATDAEAQAGTSTTKWITPRTARLAAIAATDSRFDSIDSLIDIIQDDMNSIYSALNNKIIALDSKLTANINSVESELTNEIATVETKTNNIYNTNIKNGTSGYALVGNGSGQAAFWARFGFMADRYQLTYTFTTTAIQSKQFSFASGRTLSDYCGMVVELTRDSGNNVTNAYSVNTVNVGIYSDEGITPVSFLLRCMDNGSSAPLNIKATGAVFFDTIDGKKVDSVARREDSRDGVVATTNYLRLFISMKGTIAPRTITANVYMLRNIFS